MSSSVQVTAENAGELIALAVQADALGGVPKAPAEETKQEETAADPAKPAETQEGLEIKAESEKPAEEKQEKPAESAEKFSMDTIRAEFEQNGKLSDETNSKLTKALEAAGFENPEAILDQYFQGFQAARTIEHQTVINRVGGQENYDAMRSWAKASLPQAEIDQFNKAVNTPEYRQMAIDGMFARYQAANGFAQGGTKTVKAGANTGPALEPIHNLHQLSQITADPRFNKDPAWRAQQEARLKASIAAGVYKDYP